MHSWRKPRHSTSATTVSLANDLTRFPPCLSARLTECDKRLAVTVESEAGPSVVSGGTDRVFDDLFCVKAGAGSISSISWSECGLGGVRS
jgi:hypothetical protein